MSMAPLALACGHVVTEQAAFTADPVGDGKWRTRVECPEGCGLQEFVADGRDAEPCSCPFGLHTNTCEAGYPEAEFVELGALAEGTAIEVEFE